MKVTRRDAERDREIVCMSDPQTKSEKERLRNCLHEGEREMKSATNTERHSAEVTEMKSGEEQERDAARLSAGK
jgi:hypothetical protein